MSLKYPFREVFRRKILRPKRLWAVLEDLDSKISNQTDSDTVYDDTVLSGKVSALETAIGDEETANSILARIKALEDAQSTP